MMRSNRVFATSIVTVLVILGSLAAVALAACGGSDAPASTADIAFISPGDFTIADYAGKPLVVNYFGSWCGPCNLEAPELAAFAESHPGLALVGVASDDTQDDVLDFMGKYGLSNPVVLDDGSLQADAGITGVPTTIFYDAKGNEVDRIVGAATAGQFDLSYAKAK
jgi:cytochrome c biogenesis protein CcmG/thiol:disulfide interchange protein DsbE